MQRPKFCGWPSASLEKIRKMGWPSSWKNCSNNMRFNPKLILMQTPPPPGMTRTKRRREGGLPLRTRKRLTERAIEQGTSGDDLSAPSEAAIARTCAPRFTEGAKGIAKAPPPVSRKLPGGFLFLPDAAGDTYTCFE